MDQGPGSGVPTKTAIGTAGGAAAGAAVGQAVGGKDGWWIGALTGAAVGGVAGNQWGQADARRQQRNPNYYGEIPYGRTLNNGYVQSPWSNMQVERAGLRSGEVINDYKTGNPFRIP